MTQPTVESTRCEDYPACGHGPAPYGDSGGCPTTYSDGSKRYDCVTCGTLMESGARSAICDACHRGYASREDDEIDDNHR